MDRNTKVLKEKKIDEETSQVEEKWDPGPEKKTSLIKLAKFE